MSPPCGGGAPRPDGDLDGWGGARINAILFAHRSTPPPHSRLPCLAGNGGQVGHPPQEGIIKSLSSFNINAIAFIHIQELYRWHRDGDGVI